MARKTISQRIALVGGDAIERQLRDLGQAGEKAFRNIQGAAEKLKGPGAEFARSMDRAQRKIRELGEAMKRTGEQARNWGAGLSVGITAPVTLLGRSFIQAATDAEEARSAFDFLFDENADTVRAWSRTIARELNRGSQTIQDQALSFQQLFSQVAESDEAAVKLSQDFTVLAQDLSSFYNVAESDALAKLRSGLSGEAEPLRDFGVFLNAAAVEAKALEMGLEQVGGEFTDQQKVVARAAVIMEQTAAAQGDAARTAGSYANQLKGLQGQWHDLQIAFGELILPTALKVVQALGSLVETILSLPKPVQGAIIIISALAAAVGPILMVVGQAVMGLGFLSTGFASLMASGGVLAPVLAKLAGAFGGVMGAMRGVMALVAPMLGWPVLLAAAVGALAVVIYRNWDDLVAWTADALERMRSGVASITEWIDETWSGLWSGAEDVMGSFADSIVGVFEGIGDTVGAIIDGIFDGLSSMVTGATNRLMSLGDAVASALGADGGEVPGFAGGGRVRGPGTPTSDSVLARLSTGEFVVRASAVQHYGTQVFDMLNRMSLPRGLLPGYAAGGMVGSVAVPAGAAGGDGAYATLNLSIGGELFAGLTAPRETAERLIRFATAEEVKSAGRRPAWYGGS